MYRNPLLRAYVTTLTPTGAANRTVAERGTVLDLSPEARGALGVLRHAKFGALADEATGLLAHHAEPVGYR